MRGGWKLVADKARGEEYWERRLGDVTATVVLAVVNGSSVWSYQVSCENHATVGYKENERAAKAEATRLLKWYKIRENDFRRTGTHLRKMWFSQGIRDIEPVRGSYWEENTNCAVVLGIKWQHDYESRMWRSGAWGLWCQSGENWMLRHPDGYVQRLYVSGLYNAMSEAAFWMSRCLA
jgi:hypothetical protein